MTPVTPLPIDQVHKVMKDAEAHKYLWNNLVAIDREFNALTGGNGEVTFSTRMAEWATEEPEGSIKQRVGAAVCDALNFESHDHGAKAELSDLARTEDASAQIEQAPTVKEEGQ